MPKTIYIGQDITTAEPKTIFKPKDFVDLVEEIMGPYARSYLETELDFQAGNSRSEQESYDRGYDDGYDAGFAEGYDEFLSEMLHSNEE